MPHDRDGKLLHVGDLVLVPCRIKSITQEELYCNATLETRHPMPPYENPTTITLNARQIVLEQSVIATAGAEPAP